MKTKSKLSIFLKPRYEIKPILLLTFKERLSL